MMTTDSPPRLAGRTALARLAAAVALGLACSAAWPQAVPPEAERPWWAGFGDATLNVLLADSAAGEGANRQQALERQARIGTEYLNSRVYAARARTARELRETAQRRLDLLQEAGNRNADTAGITASLLQQATEREQQFATLRTDSLARLAEALGGRYAPALLAVMLQPALEDTWLPVPQVAIPQQVPGIVLRRRPDVLQAEAHLGLAARSSGSDQLRLANYLQALAQQIGAQDAAVPPPEGAADATAPEQTLALARRDVAAHLQHLSRTTQAMEQQAARTRDAQEHYERARQAFSGAQRNGLPELTALQDLLVEEDRLAATQGADSLAWIAYQQSIGGAGDASITSLLGAGAADD